MTTKAKAATAATPDEPPNEIATTASTGADPAEVQWSNWRYTGEHANTYPAVPVTVAPGDIVLHLGPPAPDGRWEATEDEVTRRRDNDTQEG